jgi:hypothetical protein
MPIRLQVLNEGSTRWTGRQEWPHASLGTSIGMQSILLGELNFDPKHHSFNSGNTMLLQQGNYQFFLHTQVKPFQVI